MDEVEIPRMPNLDLEWHQKKDFAKSGRSHTAGTAFGALQDVWYAKLAESGFVDIEPPPANLKRCSYMSGHWLSTADRHVRGCETGAAEMYRVIESQMGTVRFPSRTARFEVALHLSGHTHRSAQQSAQCRGIKPYMKLGQLVKLMLRQGIAQARYEDADVDEHADDHSWVAVQRGGRTKQGDTE